MWRPTLSVALVLMVSSVSAIKLRESCLMDSECDATGSVCDYIACGDQRCKCPAGQVSSKDGSRCVTAKWIGEACSVADGDACLIGGICDSVKLLCVCPINKKVTEDGLQCIEDYDDTIQAHQLVGINETCDGVIGGEFVVRVCDETEQTCLPATSRCTCSNSHEPATKEQLINMAYSDKRCINPGFMADTFDSAICNEVPTVNLTDGCVTDAECPGNATCVWKNCTHKMCICKEGFMAFDLSTCKEYVAFGDPCDGGYQHCGDYGTIQGVGSSGACSCDGRGDFTDNAAGDGCIRDTDYGLIMGEACRDAYESCVAGTVCGPTSGVCECDTDAGRSPITPADHQMYPLWPLHLLCYKDSKTWFNDTVHTDICSSSNTAPTSPAPVTVNLNENCTSLNACPPNSSCQLDCATVTSTCVCDAGSVQSGDGSRCLPLSLAMEPCTEEVQCIGNGMSTFCNMTSNTCECMDAQNHLWSYDGTGYCVVEFAGYLYNQGIDMACQDTKHKCVGRLVECNSSQICACVAGAQPTTADEKRMVNEPYNYCASTAPTTTTTPACTTTTATTTAATTTQSVVKVEDNCDATHLCPQFATCEASDCNQDKCRCNLGYSPSADKVSCLEVKLPGESCTVSTICLGENWPTPTSECGGSGQCACLASFQKNTDTDGAYCMPTMMGYEGETGCDPAAQSLFCAPDTGTCNSDTCRCPAGETTTTLADKKDYLGYNFCKSNTLAGRAPFTCASTQTVHIDYLELVENFKKEKAARETKITEDETTSSARIVLIASICGVVLFIIVAVVILGGLRHARRQHRKVDECENRSDSSTLSLFRGYKNWFHKNHRNQDQML